MCVKTCFVVFNIILLLNIFSCNDVCECNFILFKSNKELTMTMTMTNRFNRFSVGFGEHGVSLSE